MSSLEYYNNVVGFMEMFYDSHKRLIEKICIDLEMTDRVDELIEKYLDNTIKLKPKKDPKKPKRPLSGYGYFCRDYREALESEKMSFSDMNKKLGSMWKELTEESRKKYIKSSEEDKERYDTEMEIYSNTYLL